MGYMGQMKRDEEDIFDPSDVVGPARLRPA